MKRLILNSLFLLLISTAVFAAGQGEEQSSVSEAGVGGNVMLYSSMKDSQLTVLKEAFTAKYPDITQVLYGSPSQPLK